MTIIIAHRGNTHGAEPKFENHPEYIQAALDAGYQVEIDLWADEATPQTGYYMLGHDRPEYPVDEKFLKQNHLWVHCKNIEAALECHRIHVWHYFFHNKDAMTLTSSGYFWTYPDRYLPLTHKSIAVSYSRTQMVWEKEQLEKVAGICTDDASHYRELFK